MLEINDTQAKILRTFMDNYRDNSNKISIGLTAHQLEKYDIVSKTFRNNREFFLKNYFLRSSAVGYHGGKNYYYFQITKFGILAYLKWSGKQKFSVEFWLDKDHFPLLWKYWSELIDIYGEKIFDVVQKSITCLEITHQLVIVVRGKEIASSAFSEILTVPVGKVELKLFNMYPVFKLNEIPNKRSWGVEQRFQSLNQDIDDRITQRFTFLVYYNLLNSGLVGDVSLMLNYVTSKFFLKENLTESDLENLKRESFDFVKEMKQNTEKLFRIIKNDKELHNLMKVILSEITESMNNRKALKTIIERLG